jgi:hypothetical protein
LPPPLVLRLMIHPFVLSSVCVPPPPPHTFRFLRPTSVKVDKLLEIFPFWWKRHNVYGN